MNRIEDLIKEICRKAKADGACRRFTESVHTLKTLCSFALSPEGLEFMLTHNFPIEEEVQALEEALNREGTSLRRYGIFTGRITLDADALDALGRRALFVGSSAVAHLLINHPEHYTLCFMRGAQGYLNVTRYAVVNLHTDGQSSAHTEAHERAIILS
jgi:hypothetical protein